MLKCKKKKLSSIFQWFPTPTQEYERVSLKALAATTSDHQHTHAADYKLHPTCRCVTKEKRHSFSE